MSERSTTAGLEVRKSVVVEGTPERAFAVFTERPMDWWPPHHVLVRRPRVAITFEPRVGGRYYEVDAEGEEADWGRVLVWEPPHRLAMTWRVNGHWQRIGDDEASEIEVTFVPLDSGRTRVELAHLHLDRLGDTAEAMMRALDGPSPGETLASFARAV
ncbi:uncharacterized protein YndB with AHSA1/START domain [Prauserella shujinwangii]|uniref:Uncharacterized protein YndB with AHSA1/START domain n=1 Tax=Prauserella shujinwangii TaxID=1453103 RepID=A0A2T0M3Z0_9PSEU|nr:SRPBCC family protein [Prauserella shujinwangii]PRX51422.1 uncharacterized protein YndB with AHSA1/START domain [Prauserella shujinwangii]